MSAEEFSKTRIGKTYLEPDPQEMSRREQEMSRLREKYRGDKSDSMTDTSGWPPMAGLSFPWDHIAGLYMRVNSFIRLAQVDGDTVGPAIGPAPYRTFGSIHGELPTGELTDPEQRIVAIPIYNRGDYKSVFRAHLDSGVKSGVNELVVLCEYQTRGLFGSRKPCIHVAGYPAGTWQGFFDAVKRYAPAEFRWPPPLFLYSPPVRTIPTNPFPIPTEGLNNNLFLP